MAYKINLKLADGWKINQETYTDESGAEISHLEAFLPESGSEIYKVFVDIYAGEMPEGETAEDQAYANYAETIGFSEEEDEENPILKYKFNGKNAWGFEAMTEENFPMRFISQEVRKGVLAIVVCCAKDDETLLSTFDILEKGLRIE